MSKKDIIIDWLEFTIKSRSFKEVLNDLSIKFDELIMLNTGFMHYNLTFVYKEKIKFLLSITSDWYRSIPKDEFLDTLVIDENLGIHIILSGYACREIESLYDFDFILSYAFVFGSQISRIDVAIDVFSNDVINLKRIKHYIRHANMVSKAKKAIMFDERVISTGEISGSSVRIGSSYSESMVVIYDKLKERANADYVIDESITAWNRIEIRLRRDTALNFLTAYFMEYDLQLGLLSSHVLSNLISFKDWSDKDKNRSRRLNADWWIAFLDDLNKLKLSKKSIQATIQQKQKWVHKNVLPTIASVFLANLDYLVIENISLYILEGIKKINEMSLSQINTYRVERGASVLSITDLEEIRRHIQSLNYTND